MTARILLFPLSGDAITRLAAARVSMRLAGSPLSTYLQQYNLGYTEQQTRAELTRIRADMQRGAFDDEPPKPAA
ncbi:MAG: hypothetical protein HMLKMBBP_01524 [Planctomycetes bacterium]|nr:hypothetical protein [Planctomycetota bacterium]